MLNTIQNSSIPDNLKQIAEKVFSGKRISREDGILLYEKGELGFLGSLANHIREQKNGDNTYFNKNIHVEPTNVCINNCSFCSYSRKQNETGCWELNLEDILEIIKKHKGKNISEIHIVGGVHPERDLQFYCDMLKGVKEIMPNIHIKAFTAAEIDFMIKKSGYTLGDGLDLLKKSGLDAIPGGGAEIFDEEIRKIICPEKITGQEWLDIHEESHKHGIPTNATMLYGHMENYAHRIDHLDRLRTLQDKTGLFQAFIPLKFRNKNNKLSHLAEVSGVEDMKNYAISRIYLDNFNHIKAYWPMIGKEATQLALSFGVDDIDGTIEDTTKIYSMAGSEEQSPALSTEEIVALIKTVKRTPIERDTMYNVINKF
jgi:aminodeoxyfutalosine synthase